ncbi:MAG: HDOD domain-containing protein [Planctomycetes bacterium]|nr:HDOD domain-containing protein [Planctomycetota bacterium]
MPDDNGPRLEAHRLVEGIDALPTLPSIVARVNELVQDPSTSAADLNAVISRDLVLSGRLLKLVNSSMYGFPRKIANVTHAVVILGFNTVRNVVLSSFVLDAFDAKDLPFGYRDFWVHSVAVATAASGLLQPFSHKEADDGFICGLLHDIGKVVMHQYARERFAEVLEVVKTEDSLLVEAETKVLGYNHADVGGILLDQWHLPTHIVQGVSRHHTEARGQAPGEDAAAYGRLAAGVHVADILVRALLIGSGGDKQIPRLSHEALGALGIGLDDIPLTLEHASDNMSRIQGFLEIL